jgi:hypothetical protein
MNIDQVAKAFINGNSAACHNSNTNGTEYKLHGHVIAKKTETGFTLYWCGWYTMTTANHMNKILKAAGKNVRVSYAQSRELGVISEHVTSNEEK